MMHLSQGCFPDTQMEAGRQKPASSFELPTNDPVNMTFILKGDFMPDRIIKNRKAKGFSLIELLIVVAIILIIAAMSIPNLMRSRISANEASAISSMRTINTAQTTYNITYPQYGYADTLAKLAFPATGQPVDQNAAGLLDWVIGCPTQPCLKSSYMFSIVNVSGSPVSSYGITAYPYSPGTSGVRGFCSNQLSNMTYDPNGATNCTLTLQ